MDEARAAEVRSGRIRKVKIGRAQMGEARGAEGRPGSTEVSRSMKKVSQGRMRYERYDEAC